MNNVYMIFIIIFMQGCDAPIRDNDEKVISSKVISSEIISSEIIDLTNEAKKISKEEKLKSELIGDYMDEKSASKYLRERKKMLPQLKKMSLIQLLSKAETLPDGGQLLPKGDYYAEEIINRGDKVVPLLIEVSLNQEVVSKVRYYDSLNYFIRDVAVNLIPYASNGKFRLEKFFYRNKGSDGYLANPHLFNQTYVINFFKYTDDNVPKSNKSNHMKLYKMLKKWEKETYSSY